jgi:hypothetical protein
VIVVQDLHGGGKEGADLVPDPLRPIADHAQAHLCLGDQPGLLHAPQRRSYVLVPAHLVPAQQMHDPLPLHQVEAKALGLLPLPLPPGPLGPRVPAAGHRPLGLFWPRRDKRPIDRQHQDRSPRLPRSQLRHTLGNRCSRGAHLQHVKLVAQFPHHRMDGMLAQRQAGQLRKQLLSRLKGHLRRQSGPRLLPVPLLAAPRQLQGFVQGSEALLTVGAIEVGAGQGHLADHRVYRARRRRSCRQETLTLGTQHGALVEQSLMLLFHQGFGNLARQLLAHGKHGLGQLLQARGVIRHGGLQSIQPTVQVGMQLLAGAGLGKGLSGLLKGDHGGHGHRGLLHRWVAGVSSLATLPQWSPREACW